MKRIRKKKPLQERLEYYSIPEPNSGCWLWMGLIVNSGYGSLWYDGTPHLAHRLSYICFVGPIGDRLLVCHSCDNRLCINPDHLFLSTQLGNMADMIIKGRACRGASHHRSAAKLTPDKVMAIFYDTRSQQTISNAYNVDPSLISYIKNKKIWAYLHKEH